MSDEGAPGNGVEAEWGDKKVKVFGMNTILILVLATALGLFIWDNRQAQAKFQEGWDNAVAARKLQAELSAAQHRDLQRQFEQSLYEVLYVLTLSADERDKVRRKLEVPERLR